MNQAKSIKKAFFLLIMSLSCNNVLAKDIHCALGTDCVFPSLKDYILIPTAEKEDYKCHVSQKMLADGPYLTYEVFVVPCDTKDYTWSWSSPCRIYTRIYLNGKGINEGNIYIPKRYIYEKGEFSFGVHYDCRFLCTGKKLTEITVNCVKL